MPPRFGVVQGLEDADDTWVWKAVPFARPPKGRLRWRAPQDPVPWEGVRRQTSFNGGCTQFSEVFSGQINGSEPERLETPLSTPTFATGSNPFGIA